MRVGITMDDDRGLEGSVSQHFGQCKYFLLADIEKGQIQKSRVVQNTASHGGGGCTAVNEILQYNITHVISGGMGMGAQQKFADANVKICGYSGKVKDALNELMKDSLEGLGACKEHGDCH